MNQTIKIINDFSEIDTSSTEKVIHQISNQLNLSGRITIKLGSIAESCELNMQFLNKNYATDVLSFPIKEEFPDGYYLGDIFICLPLAQQQALDNKISVEHELMTLMIHGLLHLAGYDHETDSGEMFKMQDGLIDQFFP